MSDLANAAPRTVPLGPPLIVLAAGGTGGHVFPAEALATELLARGASPVLITDRRGKAFGDALAAIPVLRIRSGGIAGLGAAARIRNLAELAIGLLQATRHIRALRPAIVVGFGGYAALPTMIAAAAARKPTIVHDQNAVLGRTNRLLAGRVSRICTAWERTFGVPARAGTKIVHVGMPVRPSFVARRDHLYVPPAPGATVQLLVLGGSQGAKVFSDVVPAALALLSPDVRSQLSVVQQCRPDTIEAVRAAYARSGIVAELSAFFSDVPDRLAAAQLLIARAGASTLAETTVVGRPAILVPYPFAIDDHQRANAEAVTAAGGALTIPQRDFTAESLARLLTGLLADTERLARMAAAARGLGVPDAASRLADVVLRAAGCFGDSAGRPLLNGPIRRAA